MPPGRVTGVNAACRPPSATNSVLHHTATEDTERARAPRGSRTRQRRYPCDRSLLATPGGIHSRGNCPLEPGRWLRAVPGCVGTPRLLLPCHQAGASTKPALGVTTRRAGCPTRTRRSPSGRCGARIAPCPLWLCGGIAVRNPVRHPRQPMWPRLTRRANAAQQEGRTLRYASRQERGAPPLSPARPRSSSRSARAGPAPGPGTPRTACGRIPTRTG